MFIPLHVKSDHSLGLGTASVSELAEAAAALGYPAIALTDVESRSGQVRFHYECRQHGIKPITGIEIRSDFRVPEKEELLDSRITLLAIDDHGYRSLCRIVSRRGGAIPCPVDTVELIERYCRGVVALSDNPTVIARLQDGRRFPADRLGLLLVRPRPRIPDDLLLQRAGRLGIRVVADLEPVFLQESDYPLRKLLAAIRKGVTTARLRGSILERSDQ
jgi:DNA polymerase III subunit alpha